MNRLFFCGVFFAAAGTALADEPLVIEGHNAIYLTETDEVNFRVRFNRDPGVPDLRIGFGVPDIDPVTGRISYWTSVFALDIADRGMAEVTLTNMRNGQELESYEFPYRFDGTIFSTTVPFACFRSQPERFWYIASADSTIGRYYEDREGFSTVNVPEPSAIVLGVIGLAACAGYRWKQKHRQPRDRQPNQTVA